MCEICAEGWTAFGAWIEKNYETVGELDLLEQIDAYAKENDDARQ